MFHKAEWACSALRRWLMAGEDKPAEAFMLTVVVPCGVRAARAAWAALRLLVDVAISF
jgi:hypothetical protein